MKGVFSITGRGMLQRSCWLTSCIFFIAAAVHSSAQQTPDLKPFGSPVSGPPGIIPLCGTSGDTIRVSGGFGIGNIGKGDAAAFSTVINLVSTADIASTVRVATLNNDALKAGSSSSWLQNVSFVIPSGLSAGNYRVEIVVDPENVIAESDETNNVMVLNQTLCILRGKDIDLVPTSFFGSAIVGNFSNDSSPVAVAPEGKLYPFPWLIWNRGTDDAPPFNVKYYLSKEPFFSQGDFLLGGISIPGLPAQSSQSVIPGPLKPLPFQPPGDYYFLIVVDPEGLVPEEHGPGKSNNIISVPVTVLPVKSDAQPVYRAQLVLTTGNVKSAGTNDTVFAKLNSANLTWLDYAGNDFQKKQTRTYELTLNGIATLGDVGNIGLGKEGSDGWCIASVELLLNDAHVFRKQFSPCIWLDPPGGPGEITVATYSELRQSADWQRNPPLITSLPRASLEDMIEGLVGNSIHGTRLYWGHLNGRPVEVSRKSDNAIHVDLDLALEVPQFPDPALDVDFNMTVTCEVMDKSPQINMTVSDIETGTSEGLYRLLAPEIMIVEHFVNDEIGDHLKKETWRLNQQRTLPLDQCPPIKVAADGSIDLNPASGNSTESLRFPAGSPLIETFVGYSYSQYEQAGRFPAGWNSALTFTATDKFGLLLDVSGQYQGKGTKPFSTSSSTLQVLAGPQFSVRNRSHLIPFVRVLAGVARSTFPTSQPKEATGVAWGLGAGLDATFRKFLAYRVVQADYIQTRWQRDIQNHLRLSSGIVFRFGWKPKKSEGQR